MNIRLHVRGFFKRTILEFIGTILNTEIDPSKVEIYVRIKFREEL